MLYNRKQGGNMKNYISKAYEDKIQISLANISSSTQDKFKIVGMSYIPATFKCELCGHEPCLYSFTILNTNTQEQIKVGSECVNHFKGECDIDVAEGLKKRIKRDVRKMRRYMKKVLDEDYKEMTKERKRELTVKVFMRYQLKEKLKQQGNPGKKVRLKREEVEEIVNNTIEEIEL
jgi:hypothetical protein